MIVLGPAVLRQFDHLVERHPGAKLDELPGPSGLVTLPSVLLPDGWSKDRSSVWFLVPTGYPGPCPDCFWADADLRLADGRIPRNAGQQTIPNTTINALWFSWHVTSGWNPARDSLVTFFGVILDRFRQPS